MSPVKKKKINKNKNNIYLKYNLVCCDLMLSLINCCLIPSDLLF